MRITILAISGSLKSTSSNTTILKALAKLLPENYELVLFNQLAEIPHFNPEHEEGNAAVSAFRQQLKRAGAVIISTPEYAFGVPGVLKNALDWIVSSGELNEKPVMAISASPLYGGGDKAMASLLLTLSALGAKMDAQSSLSIPDILNKIKQGELTDQPTLEKLTAQLDHLLDQVHS